MNEHNTKYKKREFINILMIEIRGLPNQDLVQFISFFSLSLSLML